MFTCRDLVGNGADIKKIGELFMTLQASTTPTSLLMPWFPSPARKAGRQASTELYTMLYAYIETRRHAEPTSDPIDLMIAEGEANENIIQVSSTPRVA